MLTKELILKAYHRLRLMSYRAVFQKVRERDGSLSATEAYSVDVINLLGEPTLSTFANYLDISQPNATYKVNNLVAKGYLEKVKYPEDRRECRLRVTEKFTGYYPEDTRWLDVVLEEMKQRFTSEELDCTARVLDAMMEKL